MVGLTACKEFHDARASRRVAFLCFSANVDNGYIYANYFLVFLHHDSLSYLTVFTMSLILLNIIRQHYFNKVKIIKTNLK